MRKGCFASIPRRYTVSMCASSRIFFAPLPSKRACTTLPIFAGVSSMRYAPSVGSTSTTLPPSAERRPAISLAARSRPSRSRLPVSIETSSFNVSRNGWRSFFASASTGSAGCAGAGPGRAVAKKAAVQRRRTSGLTVPPSDGGGKTEFYPGGPRRRVRRRDASDLLRLDVRLLRDIPENDHLLAHELRELVGLHRRGRDADPAELLAHFLPLQDRVHLGVQLLDRGGRRSGARPHAEPERKVVVREALLGQRGNVRHDRRALRGGDPERRDLAFLQVPDGSVERRHVERSAPCDRVLDRLGRALVGDVQHFYAGNLRNVFRRHVRGGPYARGCEWNLAGLRASGVDQRFQRRVGAAFRRDHHIGRVADERDVDDVLQRIVRQGLVDGGVRRVRGRLHQQRVAVGVRVQHRLRADDAARAGAVLHQHRLLERVAQVLRDDAPGDVGARAGSERDDDADRLGWVVLREGGAGRAEDCGGGKSGDGFHDLPFYLRIPASRMYFSTPGWIRSRRGAAARVLARVDSFACASFAPSAASPLCRARASLYAASSGSPGRASTRDQEPSAATGAFCPA